LLSLAGSVGGRSLFSAAPHVGGRVKKMDLSKFSVLGNVRTEVTLDVGGDGRFSGPTLFYPSTTLVRMQHGFFAFSE
jgi:hypothetical protein